MTYRYHRGWWTRPTSYKLGICFLRWAQFGRCARPKHVCLEGATTHGAFPCLLFPLFGKLGYLFPKWNMQLEGGFPTRLRCSKIQVFFCWILMKDKLITGGFFWDKSPEGYHLWGLTYKIHAQNYKCAVVMGQRISCTRWNKTCRSSWVGESSWLVFPRLATLYMCTVRVYMRAAYISLVAHVDE